MLQPAGRPGRPPAQAPLSRQPRRGQCGVRPHHCPPPQAPWQWQDNGANYYFCADPACDIVYFGDDGSIIRKAQLRTVVGVKETADSAPLCYCFGVSRADAMSNPAIREYVVQQTRLGLCTCDTSNPAGRCCLKDFPRGPA
ncbi:MAG TPA: hypothetical protein VIU93_05065 [Gallionellaceae bacterium]